MNQDLLNRLRSRAGTADESDARLLMEAAAEIRKVSEALIFYTVTENWCLGGELDGNSGNFTGGPARQVFTKASRQSNLSPRDPEHLDPYGPGNGPLADEDVFRLRDHPTDQQDH